MGNSASRNEKNSVEYKENTKYREKLYKAIDEKNWEECFQVVNEEADYAEDIFQENPDTKWNILHYVIDRHSCDNEAAEWIAKIFDAIESYEFITSWKDALFDFVNHTTDTVKTPLQMALEKKYYKVGKILIHSLADISLTTQTLLNKDWQNLVLELYDRGIKINCNSYDVTDKNWWSIEHEYGYITGWESKNDSTYDKYRETGRLSTTLVLSRESRTNIVMHPLVQMFVKDKYARFRLLIIVSMIFHILWSLMNATYIMCVYTVASTEDAFCLKKTHLRTNDLNVDDTQNITTVESNIASICEKLRLNKCENYPFEGWFSWVLLAFFVVSIVKEIVEVCICPSKPYYWNQYENKGQWTAHVIFVCTYFILFFPKCSLILPMLWILVIYSINSKQIFQILCQRKFSVSTNNYQLNGMDNYVIMTTTICTHVLVTNDVVSLLWYISMGIYLLIPVATLIFLFAVIVLACCFYTFKNVLQKSVNSRKIVNWWKLGNHMLQYISITIQLCLIGYIPSLDKWNHIIASFICIVGIAASLFLVQGQLTKTEAFGIYNQMLMKGFKILIPFLLTFLPILVAYFVIFILLLPSNTNFSLNNGLGFGKMVVMLTGDLGFDDIFSKDDIPYVISANIALMFFAVTVVLLLQNLLIGLTVNDLEKLHRKAAAAHVGNRIEVINLIEKVIMSVYFISLFKRIGLEEFVIEKLCARKLDSADYTYYEKVPTGKSTEKCHGETITFWALPKSIRDGILEKKDVYIQNSEDNVYINNMPSKGTSQSIHNPELTGNLQSIQQTRYLEDVL